MAPVEESGGLKIPGELGGLAALAGVNLGSGSGSKTGLAIEVLNSREFLGRFIETYDLLIPIMAAKGWDRSTNTLEIDKDIFDTVSNTWIRDLPAPRQAKPSVQETYTEFLKLINVQQDTKTNMVRLSVEYYSPELAQQWTMQLVADLNQYMREREAADATRSIAYLNSQVAQTNLADARSMLFSLIEEQTKTLMLANVREEYVFSTVDPAVVPELKDKPKRSLIVSVAMALGGMFGVFIVLVRSAVLARRSNINR
jgi:uncharacterized protein involved in exopolysaccharide biosynthesis